MSRGPTITPAEIKRCHELKAQGMKLPAICAELKRSAPTVRKMLKMPETVQ